MTILTATTRDNLHTLRSWIAAAQERGDLPAVAKLERLAGRWEAKLQPYRNRIAELEESNRRLRADLKEFQEAHRGRMTR